LFRKDLVDGDNPFDIETDDVADDDDGVGHDVSGV